MEKSNNILSFLLKVEKVYPAIFLLILTMTFIFSTLLFTRSLGLTPLVFFILLFFVVGLKKPQLLCYLWLFDTAYGNSPFLNYPLLKRVLEEALMLKNTGWEVSDIFYVLFILVFVLKSRFWEKELSGKRLEIGTLAFALLGLISIGVGFVYSDRILLSDFRLFFYSLMIPAVVYFFDSKRKVKRCLKVFFIISAVSAFFPIKNLPMIKEGGALGLTLIERAERKTVFYGFVAGLFFILNKKSKLFWKMVALLGEGLLLFLILINKSRKYYYSLVFVFIALLLTRVLKPRKAALLLLLTALVFLCFSPASNLFKKLKPRLLSVVTSWGKGKGLNWRLYAIKRFPQDLLSRPFLGQGTSRKIGSRTYLQGFIERRGHGEYNEIIFWQEAPHNIFITVGQAGGIIGLLLFSYILIKSILLGVRTYRTSERELKLITTILLLEVVTSVFILSVERLMFFTIMQLWFLVGLLVSVCNTDYQSLKNKT